MFRNKISVYVQRVFLEAGIIPYANFCAPAVMPRWRLTRKAWEDRRDFMQMVKEHQYDSELIEHPGDPHYQEENPECWDWAWPSILNNPEHPSWIPT